MTNDEAVKQIDSAIATLTTVRTNLSGPTPGNVIKVLAGASLQSALDNAPDGATVQLDDATFPGAVKITKAVTLTSKNPPAPTRATKTAPCTITSDAPDGTILLPGTAPVTIIGVGLANSNAAGQLASVTGANVTFDRVTGLGDPAKGLHRGILLNGRNIKVLKSWFEDIFAFGRDSCVLGGWDGSRDILIDDSYLCGGAETVLFGGADSASADRLPTNITLTNSILTKKPEWYAMGVQIKNAFELKVGVNVRVADCILEYAGTAEGQGAYAMLFTVRNQNGKAPWSAIKNVLVERCLVRNAGGCASFLGMDTNFPSGTLDGVTIRNVKFTNIDPKAGPWKGDGRGFMFQRAPKNVILDSITLEGQNLGAVGYFANTPDQPVGLTLKNMVLPPSTYGWKIDAGGLDMPPASKNLKALMPDLTYAVTATDAGAAGYPNG